MTEESQILSGRQSKVSGKNQALASHRDSHRTGKPSHTAASPEPGNHDTSSVHEALHLPVYQPPPESSSFVLAESAIQELMKVANVEITWKELEKFKESFVTETAHKIAERVLEINNMKPDKTSDLAQIAHDDEDEPRPSKTDQAQPNQIKTKVKPPPPILVRDIDMDVITALKRKMTRLASGTMHNRRTPKKNSALGGNLAATMMAKTDSALGGSLKLSSNRSFLDPEDTSDIGSPKSQISGKKSQTSAQSPARSKKSALSKVAKSRKSANKSGLKDKTESDMLSERFKPWPIVKQPETQEELSPEKEAKIARYRKTIMQKDAQKKKQQIIKNQMRNYLVNKMKQQQQQGKSEHSSIMSMLSSPSGEEGLGSELPAAEIQRRNEAIFKNLTFDQQGNPLHQFQPDPEKMVSHHIQPRFRVTRKRRQDQVDPAAIKGLKDIKAKRIGLTEATNTTQTSPKAAAGNSSTVGEQSSKKHGSFSTTANEVYDQKLHSLLEKLNHKSDLRAFLSLDEKGARRIEPIPRSDINNEIFVVKGVEMKTPMGQTMKTGGKIQLNSGSLKYTQVRQHASQTRLGGLINIGPQKKSPTANNPMLNSLGEALRRKFVQRLNSFTAKKGRNRASSNIISNEQSIISMIDEEGTVEVNSPDKIKIDPSTPHEFLIDMVDTDFYGRRNQTSKAQNSTQSNLKNDSADNFANLLLSEFLSENEEKAKVATQTHFSANILSGNVRPSSKSRSTAFLQRRKTNQAQGRPPRMPPTSLKNIHMDGKSFEYLPVPQTSQGLRQRDINRLSVLNPRNERDVRLSHEFTSSTRGNVLSPQIKLPQQVRSRKSGGLVTAQSTQELHSSYQTRNLRRKAYNSFDKNFSALGSTAASKFF